MKIFPKTAKNNVKYLQYEKKTEIKKIDIQFLLKFDKS